MTTLYANLHAAHGVDVQVVQGRAPGALDGLPDPDAVFVGGGGTDVADIVRACVARLDVMRHGHAMPRPEPGFLAQRRSWWDPPRDARVLYANSDVSGLSLFEEAQYRGVTAAERALALVGRG